MILSATLSKPTAAVRERLGNDVVRVKIKLLTASKKSARMGETSDDEPQYMAELFTKTQVFHQKMTAAALDDFLAAHAGNTFHSCVERTETEEITILASKKGKVTRLVKPLQTATKQTYFAKTAAVSADGLQLGQIPAATAGQSPAARQQGFNRQKKYLLPEGVPVPFLVHLGVMTAQGKVIAAKYDKFKQINRFLECVDDVLPAVLAAREKSACPVSAEHPLRVVDFGSGKSYLTFAVQYLLTTIRGIPCDITGLDLKEDVIAYCSRLAAQCDCPNLHFAVGDIAHYGETATPDIVITLHACDTATDYALDYAVKHCAAAILSVPCCQHELNAQLDYRKIVGSSPTMTDDGQLPPVHDSTLQQNRSPACDSALQQNISPFAPLLKHGILKERFAALATDALRAEYLEAAGYKVQVLEFIDMSHTPKNLLIRAVRRTSSASDGQSTTARVTQAHTEADALTNALSVTQTLGKMLAK